MNQTTIADDPIPQLKTCERARRKGLDFLLDHINEDGSLPQSQDRVTIYRVPWALALGGESAAAHRVLGRIEQTGIGRDGAFHGGNPWIPAANHTFNTYPETCLAYGAQLLGRFDIARQVMAFANQFQDAETGGVYMDRQQLGDDGYQLLFLTCQFGMSALVTGDLESAIRTAQWLQHLREAQPAFPDRLYTVWTRAGGLATSTPAGEDARHFVNNSQNIREFHYNGGIAAAFLGKLYLQTSDNAWLQLAEEFQAFSMNSTEHQFETRQVCKSAWGASQLAIATGAPTHMEWASKMGAWFSATQEADGHWNNSAYLAPRTALEHQIEITAEFIIHLDSVIAALASRH